MISAVALTGALLAVFAGLLNGTYTLAMRYLGKWEWENVWLLFIIVCCLIMPIGIVFATVSAPLVVLAQAPAAAVIAAVVSGAVWGFGAILYGQGVSAAGISMANTIILAISASLGSLLSMLVLSPASLGTAHGLFILLGTAVAIVGMVISGVAGGMRERNRREQNEVAKEGEGTLVGKRRPLSVAILICIGAGILSAIFNIGFAMAQPIIVFAQSAGLSASGGTNLVWLLMLVSGSIVNIVFCVWMLIKNQSAHKFLLPGPRLYILTAFMGVAWAGSIFIYGEAATRLGALGPAIGWPLFLTTGLLVSNLCGVIAGEWRATATKTRIWMASGLAILVLAILVLGKAGAM